MTGQIVSKYGRMIFFFLTLLVKGATAQENLGQFISTENSLQNFVRTENTGSRMFTGAAVPNFSPREETVGTRYLLGKWTPGMVVDKQDSVISNPTFLYNYDKITQSLLMTVDRKSVLELYKDQIKSFKLNDEGLELQFLKNPLNPDGPFLEVITNGKNYVLSASLKTRLVKSQYSTNGIMETGKPYDEYVDQYNYFVSSPDFKNMVPVELKRKSILKAFAASDDQVQAFMDKNYAEIIDGNFLRALVENLNGQ